MKRSRAQLPGLRMDMDTPKKLVLSTPQSDISDVFISCLRKQVQYTKERCFLISHEQKGISSVTVNLILSPVK